MTLIEGGSLLIYPRVCISSIKLKVLYVLKCPINILGKSQSITHFLPEYALVFSILILSHCEKFEDVTNHQTLNLIERCIRPVVDALLSDKKSFSYSLVMNTIEGMKHHKDILDNDSNTKSVVSYFPKFFGKI